MITPATTLQASLFQPCVTDTAIVKPPRSQCLQGIRGFSLSLVGVFDYILAYTPPTEFDLTSVMQIDDFAEGFEEFPPSDILRYQLVDGSRVIVRPSGTEPKLKAYIDARSMQGRGEDRLARARDKAIRIASDLRGRLVPPAI